MKQSSDVATNRTERHETGGQAPGPLYLQVARTLRDDIVNGSYPVGSQLPTEEELRARFSVSRFTVREALRRLRDDGLVASRQGAGTVVVPGPSETDLFPTTSISDLLAWANDTRFEIESIGMITIDSALSTRISIPTGEEWLRVRGLRLRDDNDVPVSWIEYYINRNFASVGRLLPRSKGPIFPLIEDLFGVTISEVEHAVSASILAPALAAKLGVEKKSAALEILRSYRTSDGRIAQVTVNTHPAARHRHRLLMQRAKG
jgi:DNA-binding GntR family transcriptional regulator